MRANQLKGTKKTYFVYISRKLRSVYYHKQNLDILYRLYTCIITCLISELIIRELSPSELVAHIMSMAGQDGV